MKNRIGHQKLLVARGAESLPRPWREIALGHRDLSTLTDEEVFKGRLKTPSGTSWGNRPPFYPQNFIDEQIRRSLSWAQGEIREGARDAITVIRDIMNDPDAPYADRLKAAMFFTDRFLGKDVQKVLVQSEDPVETLFRQILAEEQAREMTPEERELLG